MRTASRGAALPIGSTYVVGADLGAGDAVVLDHLDGWGVRLSRGDEFDGLVVVAGICRSSGSRLLKPQNSSRSYTIMDA
jgi:hypothetical protein